jgi:TPR repeat protein
VTAAASGLGAVVRVLGNGVGEIAMTLDSLRDPETGARLALVRADGSPVVGLPDGQTTPLLAVVDTGLDSSHPWIAKTLVGSVDLTGQGEEDHNGHGTWVALTLLWLYPLPVGLLNVKALGNDGTGTVDALTRGIRRAAGLGATVINISAGVSQPWCRADCPLCRAALAAADEGIVVAAAAGNVAGETACPAKAGLLHPGRGVGAAGVTDVDTWALQPYSGVGTEYVPSPAPILLPADEPVGGPKYRKASASAAVFLAVSLASRGDLAEATRRLDQVVAINGYDGEPDVRAYAGLAMVDKGLIFHRNGRLQDELACYQFVIERYGADPAQVVRDNVAWARFLRAQRLELLGDTAGALADYGAIIGNGQQSNGAAPRPRRADALAKRGLLLRTLGQREASVDLRTARDWYEKAAQSGDPDAMANLGALLHDSEPEAARGWYEKAAQSGKAWTSASAMYNLGILLEHSEPRAAQDWYEKAANAGYANAMYNLGVLLQHSEPGTARGWIEKAAQAGQADAMYGLGLLLHDSEPEAARGWFQKAAEAGHANAMYNIGALLHNSEPEAARGWIEKAAQAGHADAMYDLGALLYNRDPGAARRWFEKAAQAGHTDAMNALRRLS